MTVSAGVLEAKRNIQAVQFWWLFGVADGLHSAGFTG
jgi:hypothetical protein